MRIFVGGLWAKVSRSDLDQLVAEALRGPWYKFYAPRGQITKCELLQLTDLNGGNTEYSAVISVEPSRLGWEVVQYLEGLFVNKSQLTSHKWFPRNGLSDRRVLSSSDTDDGARERRAKGIDRRRELNVQPLGRNMVRAVQGFERSYGS